MNSRGSEIEFEVEEYISDKTGEQDSLTINNIKHNSKAHSWETQSNVLEITLIIKFKPSFLSSIQLSKYLPNI
jgi:hypothetical protein